MKPGDIVTLSAKAREQAWYPRWLEINGDGPFMLGTTALGYSAVFHIKATGRKRIKWDEKAFGVRKHIISTIFLRPQPFLTAVKNAIESKGER